jgi:hypothetical protein
MRVRPGRKRAGRSLPGPHLEVGEPTMSKLDAARRRVRDRVTRTTERVPFGAHAAGPGQDGGSTSVGHLLLTAHRLRRAAQTGSQRHEGYASRRLHASISPPCEVGLEGQRAGRRYGGTWQIVTLKG